MPASQQAWAAEHGNVQKMTCISRLFYERPALVSETGTMPDMCSKAELPGFSGECVGLLRAGFQCPLARPLMSVMVACRADALWGPYGGASEEARCCSAGPSHS